MATLYVDVSFPTNTTGSEVTPYNNPLTALTAASAGDTIKVRTTRAQPWLPTSQYQDTKGVKLEPWDTSVVFLERPVIHMDLSVATVNGINLNHVNAEVKLMELYNAPAGVKAVRLILAPKLFDDIFVHDCGDDGIISQPTVDSYTTNRVRLARCKYGLNSNAGSASGAEWVYNAFYSYGHNFYDTVQMTLGTITFNNPMILDANSSQLLRIQGSTDVIINNPVIIDGKRDLTAANDAILNSGTGTVTINKGAVTRSIFEGAEPNVKGFSTGLFVHNGNKGNSNPVGKLFDTPRRGGFISFKRDDLSNYITGGPQAGEYGPWLDALEARGLRGTYSTVTRGGDLVDFISTAGWDDIRDVVNRGHEISTEGTTGAAMHNTDMLTVQYTGAAAVCRLVIANDTLKTYEDGVLDLNISFASPYRISVLTNAINGNADYTATVDTTDGGLMNPTVLAEVDIADVKASPVTLVIDPDKTWTYELGICKQDIIDKTGFTPVSHTYSTASYSATAAAYMQANGWLGGRLSATNDPTVGAYPKPFTDDKDLYSSFGLHVGGSVDSSSLANLARHIDGWCQWAEMTGAAICIYNHAFSTTSLAEWEVIFDAVIGSGIQIGTMKEMYEWLAAAPVPTDATDDAWIPKPAADSPNSGAGVNNFTGRRERGIDGERFTSTHVSFGPVQGTESPYHAKNQ